ncbi:hypothetical protein JKY72_04780 [Candidatus Gracilibacteria bacterium]|nr:hypothetical protein [Candidatus Gracilibacteria bacterium]
MSLQDLDKGRVSADSFSGGTRVSVGLGHLSVTSAEGEVLDKPEFVKSVVVVNNLTNRSYSQLRELSADTVGTLKKFIGIDPDEIKVLEGLDVPVSAIVDEIVAKVMAIAGEGAIQLGDFEQAPVLSTSHQRIDKKGQGARCEEFGIRMVCEDFSDGFRNLIEKALLLERSK